LVIDHLICKLTVRGAWNIPDSGAAILVANHLSELDDAVLVIASPRRLTFLGAAKLLKEKKALVRGVGGIIPVERGNMKSGVAALRQAKRVLEGGGVIVLHPEGARSEVSHQINNFHGGAAVLAMLTGVPVIPVGIVETDKVMPIGVAPKLRPFQYKPTVEIYIGRPVNLAGLENNPSDREEATNRMQHAVRTLSGQESSGVWATLH
jgi:1-acyl-sn-glycerol-3-phosphate acyltransferase